MTRLVAWWFVARDRDGVEGACCFYEQTAEKARKLAEAWAKRVGQEIVFADDKRDEGGEDRAA